MIIVNTKKQMLVEFNKLVHPKYERIDNAIVIQDKKFESYYTVINHLEKLLQICSFPRAFNLELDKQIIEDIFGYRSKEIDTDNIFLPKNMKEYVLMLNEQNVFTKADIMIATAHLLKAGEKQKVQDLIINHEYWSNKLLNFKMWRFTIDLSDSDFIYQNFNNFLQEHGLKEKYTKKQEFLSQFKIFGKMDEPYSGFHSFNKFVGVKNSNLRKQAVRELELIQKKTNYDLTKHIEKLKTLSRSEAGDYCCWTLDKVFQEMNRKLDDILQRQDNPYSKDYCEVPDVDTDNNKDTKKNLRKNR